MTNDYKKVLDRTEDILVHKFSAKLVEDEIDLHGALIDLYGAFEYYFSKIDGDIIIETNTEEPEDLKKCLQEKGVLKSDAPSTLQSKLYTVANEQPNNKIWLITGESSGLDLEMALSALRSGHRVIGTARKVAKAAADHPEFKELGGKWLQLDVFDPATEDTAKKLIAQEDQRGVAHRVLVNNAGNTLLGTVEDMSDT
ncbi:hypothetical protein FSARC_8240 [Fusarium sarcochroum]|uniref:Uncharacterized protein n=1 Tax=Fusarium sarcochroum TaxID=1208366 RepID=A0A8H4TTH6_9HYPO|nr:hypothetical protein FSARC_8240 [Fusarium sarcochroum]